MTNTYIFPIDFNNGTFRNVVFTGELLQLEPAAKLADSTGYIHLEGSFLSDVLSIGDVFKEFGVLEPSVDLKGGSVTIYTTTSMDGEVWDLYKEVVDGKIQSPVGKYIRIKIDITARIDRHTYMEYDFVQRDETLRIEPNEFLAIAGGLRLKYTYASAMLLDISWSGEGGLHREKITRDEWVRIDKMNVLRVVK